MRIEDTILFGKYQICSIIGKGRSGTVFLAVHIGLQEYRAIKRVPKSYLDYERFRKEAMILKDLRHPGIPIVYDLEEDSEYSYLIEEFLEGESLFALVNRLGYLSKTRMIHYGIQICHLVNHLHSAKPDPILYLDLQPKNLLLSNELVKLIDFDHAASLADANSARKRYGTIGCAAPEQFTGEPLDQRTDIYAIGVILYYLGTGEYPGEDLTFLKNATIWGDELVMVIRTCLNPDKDRRYQSVACLQERLEQIKEKQAGVFKQNQSSSLKIALVGSKSGVGTTHFSIGLSVYLRKNGYPNLYEEKNYSKAVCNLADYFDVALDERGIVQIQSCKLKSFFSENVRLEPHSYQIIILDYGTDWCTVRDEKSLDIILLVNGGKWWELPACEKALKTLNISSGLYLIFNHTISKVRLNLPEGIKRQSCFQMPYFPNPFLLNTQAEQCYRTILQQIMREKGGFPRRDLKEKVKNMVKKVGRQLGL